MGWTFEFRDPQGYDPMEGLIGLQKQLFQNEEAISQLGGTKNPLLNTKEATFQMVGHVSKSPGPLQGAVDWLASEVIHIQYDITICERHT